MNSASLQPNPGLVSTIQSKKLPSWIFPSLSAFTSGNQALLLRVKIEKSGEIMAEPLYYEKVQSPKTSLLFFILVVIFAALFTWRVSSVGFRYIPILYLFLGIFFFLYVLNYRSLIITITENCIFLKFGLIQWRTPLENIQNCELDDSPAIIKYGGAGVHFAFVNRIYRAYFNFLEHPRVMITLINKQGLVQALIFTTRRPEEVIKIINSNKKHEK